MNVSEIRKKNERNTLCCQLTIVKLIQFLQLGVPNLDIYFFTPLNIYSLYNFKKRFINRELLEMFPGMNI